MNWELCYVRWCEDFNRRLRRTRKYIYNAIQFYWATLTLCYIAFPITSLAPRHVSAVGIDFMKRLLTKDPNLRYSQYRMMTRHHSLRLCYTSILCIESRGGKLWLIRLSPASIPDTPSLEREYPQMRRLCPGHCHLKSPRKSYRGGLCDIIACVHMYHRNVLPSCLHPECTWPYCIFLISFRLYLSSSRLTRLVLGLIAHFICSEKVKHLKEEFLAMDTDHSGSLSPTELLVALTSRRASRGKGVSNRPPIMNRSVVNVS